MATTIPKQLYVTVQYRGDTNNESGLLGFASPYTRDAAFEKRKQTQDTWAYGSGIDVKIDAEDNVTVTGQGSGGYGRGSWDAGALFIANCFPRIIPNEPLEGFELAKSVRRWGWSGGGNVVWRITDPRGFDLEITSENFASILNCAVVDHGVISGKCVWGREGSRNVLLPENSEPFQSALKQTERVSRKVSLRDVQLGDTIEIVSSQLESDDQEHVYLGKHYYVHTRYEYDNSGRYYLAGEFRERYVLKSKRDGSYNTLASVKISQILERAEKPRDKADIAAELNLVQLSNNSEHDGGHLILPRPPRAEDIKFQVVPTEKVSRETWGKLGVYYRQSYLVDYRGQRCLAYLVKWHNSGTSEVNLQPVTFDTETGVIQKEMKPAQGNAYWGRQHYQTTTIPNVDVSELEFYTIEIASQGFTGNVRSIPG